MWSFLPGTMTPAGLISLGMVVCACFLNGSQPSQSVGSASLWLLSVFFVDMPKVMSLSRHGWQGHISLVAIQLPLTTIAHILAPVPSKFFPCCCLRWWKPLSCWDDQEGTKSHSQTKNDCPSRGDADGRQGQGITADACFVCDECHVTANAFPSSLLC